MLKPKKVISEKPKQEKKHAQTDANKTQKKKSSIQKLKLVKTMVQPNEDYTAEDLANDMKLYAPSIHGNIVRSRQQYVYGLHDFLQGFENQEVSLGIIEEKEEDRKLVQEVNDILLLKEMCDIIQDNVAILKKMFRSCDKIQIEIEKNERQIQEISKMQEEFKKGARFGLFI